MTWAQIIALFVLIIFLSSLPICIFFDIKKNNRILKETDKKNKEWLQDQLKLPLYSVLIFTKNSDDPIRSKYFKPTVGKPTQWSLSKEIDFNRETSLEAAEQFMSRVITSGAYYDKNNNVMILVCEIEFMKATNE